jgi:hypothetical protein
MNETFHHMQTNVGLTTAKLIKLRKEALQKFTEITDEEKKELRKKGVEPNEGFFNGLDQENESAGAEIVRIIDMGNVARSTALDMEHGPLAAIIQGISGSDYFKDWIKDEKDISNTLKNRIVQLGVQYNKLVDLLVSDTLEEVLVLHAALIQLNDDYEKKRADYDEEHAQFANIIDRLSRGAGSAIPRQFATVHAAVMKAHLLAETARSALPAATKTSPNPSGKEKLPKDKAKLYKIYFDLFNPDKGKLIFDGTDTGGLSRGDLLVFQKGGEQIGYRHTKHSLLQIAQLLDPVKHLFDSRTRLDELNKKWNKVLLE